MPFTIGGGVREVADAHAVLDAGADKVSVNSAAVARPELLDEMARVFGAQCVVLAIDAKRGGEGWEVHVAGGRTPTGRDAVEWAREGVGRGRGGDPAHLDGPRRHPGRLRHRAAAAISEAVDVPVIASGGAGEPRHLVDGLQAGADAVLCASIFHYGRYSIAQVKDALAEAGVPVRRDRGVAFLEVSVHVGSPARGRLCGKRRHPRFPYSRSRRASATLRRAARDDSTSHPAAVDVEPGGPVPLAG